MTLQGVRPPELVITTPGAYGADLASRTGCRLTLGVLVELVAGAKQEVILGAPYAQAGAISAGPLAAALQAALERNVRINWVSTPAALPAMRLRGSGAGALRFYQPEARLITDPGTLGSHAKFLVADEAHAYIGSANFTGRGFSDQLEMGLLLHGDPAREIARFWQYAIEIGLLVEVFG